MYLLGQLAAPTSLWPFARRRHSAVAAFMACVLIGMSAALRLSAHPLPNTEIVVSLNDGGVRLDIALPVPELRLALPASFPNDGNLLGESQQRALRAYFHEHLSLVSRNGTPQPHVAESISVSQSVDANVGQYQELRVRVWAPATEQFNPRDFTLAYDAIIHQVPNHFAIVKVAHDFRGGVLAGERAADIGMIRYDFARNEVGPLHISAAPAGLWSGFRSAIRLGFHHVATGLDHVLFLATLLVVAPLRVADGRWSLFQGWRYAVRRFLGISVAFTVGHSIALLVGAYGFVPVPLRVVEILIAGSILVAAVHAIRPLFSGREWLVAAAFGTVHGLAFSESLVGLNLTAVLRGVAVLGFNLGVESAQLVVMAAAVPLLIVSHWRVFHALRITLMVCTALLAVVWMLERAREPAVATTSHSNPVSGG